MLQGNQSTPPLTPAVLSDAQVRAKVRTAIVTFGVVRVARAIGTAPETALRIGFDLKVQVGTMLLARERAPRLDGLERPVLMTRG